MSSETESLRAVRTALRAVLGRLGQASVPIDSMFKHCTGDHEWSPYIRKPLGRAITLVRGVSKLTVL